MTHGGGAQETFTGRVGGEAALHQAQRQHPWTHTPLVHFCESSFHSPSSAQLCTALLQSSGLRATAPPGERCKGKLNVCCMLPRKGLGSIVPCPSARSPSPLHCAQRRAESCLHVQCSQGAERLLPAADSADRSSQEIEL